VDEITALTILTRAVELSLYYDLHAAEVFAALNFLAERIPAKWPFIQFQQGLNSADAPLLQPALAAIKLLLRVQQR